MKRYVSPSQIACLGARHEKNYCAINTKMNIIK